MLVGDQQFVVPGLEWSSGADLRSGVVVSRLISRPHWGELRLVGMATGREAQVLSVRRLDGF